MTFIHKFSCPFTRTFQIDPKWPFAKGSSVGSISSYLQYRPFKFSASESCRSFIELNKSENEHKKLTIAFFVQVLNHLSNLRKFLSIEQCSQTAGNRCDHDA